MIEFGIKSAYSPMGIRYEEKFERWLVALPWDSHHFAIPVARILPSELYDSDLREILLFAKSKGFHLVYWATRSECEVLPEILSNFSGLLVDKKVTYERKLVPRSPMFSKNLMDSLSVVEYTKVQTPESLLSLSVQSGNYSRFNLDPKIPKEKFESMFHIWMQRSIAHYLATVVFVAVDDSHIQKYVGVITASVEQGVGKIGLISVLSNYQSKGIGSLLMHAVHQWMHVHGVNKIVVVTQESNLAACQFYSHLGYRVAALQHFYHFWVQE